MMSPKELVTTLIAQHRVLETDLALALEQCDLGTEAGWIEVTTILGKFRNDLTAHLQLEDRVFYPDYFKKKMDNIHDQAIGNEFVKQMVLIGETVIHFLDTYPTREAIKLSEGRFRDDLISTTSLLKVRIETEEEELYQLYLEMAE